MHNTIIAFVLAMATMIYCVITIQEVFDLPSDQSYRDEQVKKNTKTQFDMKTVEQIKLLRTSTDGSITLPQGDINPFVE